MISTKMIHSPDSDTIITCTCTLAGRGNGGVEVLTSAIIDCLYNSQSR